MAHAPYKAEGIILKRKNVGETDRILTVFTKEYGKLRLLAKGIRRVGSRRAPHLEVFSRVSLFIHQGKSMDGISEVAAVAAYGGIRNDLQKVGAAYFFCELIDVLVAEKQEHREVYTFLIQTLAGLEEGRDPLHVQTRQFALELLWQLGFLPHGKVLSGEKLQSFIEDITERQLRTPKFIRNTRVLSSGHS